MENTKNYLTDENLSLGAKGLLEIINNMPSPICNRENLQKLCVEDREVVDMYLLELIDTGYFPISAIKDELLD